MKIVLANSLRPLFHFQYKFRNNQVDGTMATVKDFVSIIKE